MKDWSMVQGVASWIARPGATPRRTRANKKPFAPKIEASDAAKDGARAAITAAGAGWRKLSRAAKDRVLGPHLGR